MQQLVKINRHVQMDEHGTEYYRTERGEWAPGYYDGKKFVWISTAKYAARKRTFTMADGTTKTVRLTKYTYESFLKPAYAPIGKTGRQYKRAYKECYRALYWDGCELYKAVDILVDGSYINTIEPYYDYANMIDRWPEVERDITQLSADELNLETPKAEQPDIVTAAEEIVRAEAARLEWIASTTTEGDQISLLAYAGYGDTTWQELAYA